jgi:hypothetical protein
LDKIFSQQKQKYSAWRGGYLRESWDNDDERITNETIKTIGTAGGADAQTRACSPSDGKTGKACRPVYPGRSGASAVPAVQARMGSDRGEDAERAGHPVCVPVLSGIAPRPRPRARIPQIAARAVGQVPPRGRIKRRRRFRAEK